MKLARAEIQNFRSIEDLKISFANGCEILIGVNESGKSNILRALQLLDPAAPVSVNDLRIERQDEAPISKGHVRFVFELSDAELDGIYSTVSKQFLAETMEMPIIEHAGKELSLKEFVFSVKEGLCRVDLPSGTRNFTYWSIDQSKYKLIGGWKKLKNAEKLTLIRQNEKSVPVDGEKVLQTAVFKALESLAFEPLTVADIHSSIGAEVSQIVKTNLPKCIYWAYSEQFLLPSSVNVNEFSANPDTCLPLKSMFELAGIKSDQVGTSLSTARGQPLHRYLHLLDRVANAATSHIHDVWREHRGVRIELRPHGDVLIPVVQDSEIPLDMANRSDGFKRFVSFLLLVSAKVRTAQLANNLILVDEPEIGLHPRGARNLMNELIKIGDTNVVVYSTHSIFMVDRDRIDRHVIVEKKSEITTTWRASKSTIQDEEVLYGAIGYSIFETLHQNNVIFEGWRDKEIFRLTRESFIKNSKEHKATLEEIGLTFAEGVKDVRNVARFLELANRGCLIISDADATGIQHQREYRRQNGWGTWLTLQDILGPGSIITGEDLLTREAIVKRAKIFRKTYSNLSELTTERFSATEPSHKTIIKWLQEIATDELPLKSLQDELKNVLFDKLKLDEINSEAQRLVEFVVNHEFANE